MNEENQRVRLIEQQLLGWTYRFDASRCHRLALLCLSNDGRRRQFEAWVQSWLVSSESLPDLVVTFLETHGMKDRASNLVQQLKRAKRLDAKRSARHPLIQVEYPLPTREVQNKASASTSELRQKFGTATITSTSSWTVR